MKKLEVNSFLFCCIFSINTSGAQQKQTEHQSLYWVRYYNQWKFNDKFTWHNEIEDRRFFKGNVQHHSIYHSRLHFKMAQNAEGAAGLTFSWQSPQSPEAAAILVVPEIRGVQESNFKQSLAHNWGLSHRFRLDERFIHKNNGKELLNGYDFSLRFRYKVQLNYEPAPKTTIKLADEIMMHAGKAILYKVFDQNRISVGLEQIVSKHLSIEISYIHWYQLRNTGYQFFSRDIFRSTLMHKIIGKS